MNQTIEQRRVLRAYSADRMYVASQVPELKATKVEHDGQLQQPVRMPIHHRPTPMSMLGWALIYCLAVICGGVIAIVWSSL
jgi:hypothetical protein